VFHADIRALSQARLLVGGTEPEGLVGTADGPGRVTFVGVARELGDPGTDPTVRVTRRRQVVADGMDEEIELGSTATGPVQVDVRLEAGSDLAGMPAVRRGTAVPTVPPSQAGDGLAWRASDDAGAVRVRLTGDRARVDSDRAALTWPVVVPPRATVVVRWRLRVDDPGRVVVPPTGAPPWASPHVEADDRRLPALLHRSLHDLDTLRL
ncbi:MAG: amylo-alpha-1,6-glucosidase, partial [Actinophytocola sp.]|nr:amylo-alpha-1,6-glucosidase [Actinophytocola sp.]